MEAASAGKKHALIVAGGSGARMATSTPKQFLLLNGEPVLMHTIRAFTHIPGIVIVLVLPASQIESWKQLCSAYSFDTPCIVVEGGDTRFHSVRNGLQHITEGLVAIHDGVRPLITPAIIEHSFAVAAEKGNAVAAVKLKDSIRELTLTGGTRNANRSNFFLIQTPQTFHTADIRDAYENATHYNFTDDAGVLEEAGGKKINLIDGDYRNIKITTPGDIELATLFLASKKDS